MPKNQMPQTNRTTKPSAYIIYVLSANMFVIASFLLLYQFPQAPSVLTRLMGTFLVIHNHLVEILLLMTAGAVLVNYHIILRCIAYLAFGAYFLVNIAQLIAYYYGGEYLTQLAMENINHISHVLLPRNLLLLGIALFSVIFALPLIVERLKPCAWNSLTKGTIILALTAIFLLQFSRWAPPGSQDFQRATFEINRISKHTPLRSFLEMWIGKSVATSVPSITQDDINIARDFGIEIRPNSRYPIVKNWIYHGRSPFASRSTASDKPNIIVFFIDGISARQIYTMPVQGLTPNIALFISNQHTMVVNNYFSHTAATYRGLHGQLCSLWPLAGGLEWNKRASSLMQLKYFCLTKYLSNIGYKTHFFYSQRRNKTYLDELAINLGFNDVAAGEDLSQRYLSNVPFMQSDFISDQQLFKAVTGFVRARHEWQNQPFFLAIYNFETHAFRDITKEKDGVAFGNGSNQILNAIHNMDNAFGLFWKEFLLSALANNTIVVFTTDHAHYPERPFVDLYSPRDLNYRPLFFDQIPLIIYDPTREHPAVFNAGYRSSIDFAPSLIHYLGFPNVPNAFLGTSIFDKTNHKGTNIALASFAEAFFWADENGTHTLADSNINKAYFERVAQIVQHLQKLDGDNRIWP